MPKLLKLSNCIWTAKCDISPKCAKNGQSIKMTKTAISGGSQQSSCQGVWQSVLWVPEGVSRPVQAQEPCPAFPSLLQLNPARPGPRSLAQLPRGLGRVSIIQGAQEASQRSYRVQESFPVPRDVPRWSPGHVLLQPIGTVPRSENHVLLDTGKTLSWIFYFFYLTFKKLKSCFYMYVTGSQPYWISTSCQPYLFTNCISCQPYWFYNFTQLLQFNCEMKFRVDL